MPAVTFGTATSRASYKVRDYNGQTANFNITALNQAKVDEAVQLVHLITGTALESVSVTTERPIATNANTPTFGHQREYRAVFECTLADGSTGKMIVPAPATDDMTLSTDRRYINLADTNIANFVTFITTAGNGVQIGGKQIVGVKQAYVQHKESSVQVEKLKIG